MDDFSTAVAPPATALTGRSAARPGRPRPSLVLGRTGSSGAAFPGGRARDRANAQPAAAAAAPGSGRD